MTEMTQQEVSNQRSAALETILVEFKRLQTQISRLDGKVERLWTYIARRENAAPNVTVAARPQTAAGQESLPLTGGSTRRVAPFPRRVDGTHYIVPPFRARR